MGISAKKRKRFTTYYVVTLWNGGTYRENAGTDKREAERLDAQRLREVKAGTFEPAQKVRAWTVAEYSKQWGDSRTNVSALDDRRNLRRFTALPEFASLHMADVRPRLIIAALKKLRGTVRQKTLQNAYGSLRTMFRDAVIEDVIASSPCVLPRGFFSDEEAEEREAYTRDEAAVLLTHDAIPWPIRVLIALCVLGGMREGEACGLLWGDLDTGPEPLWALDITKQYSGRRVKTKKRRVAPVHPELRGILEAWRDVGFVELTGLRPVPTDFIVPNVSRRARARNHTKSTFYKAFVAGCAAAGVPNRTLHSTRHTMITLGRRGHADKAVLSKVTHNAKGDIVDRYTHRDWLELCEAVLAIGNVLPARSTPRREEESPQEIGGAHLGGNDVYSRGFLPEGIVGLSSIPGASTTTRLDLSFSSESRTTPRTSAAAITGENLESGEARARPEAWALALAAERVLSTRRVAVASITHRRGKGVA